MIECHLSFPCSKPAPPNVDLSIYLWSLGVLSYLDGEEEAAEGGVQGHLSAPREEDGHLVAPVWQCRANQPNEGACVCTPCLDDNRSIKGACLPACINRPSPRGAVRLDLALLGQHQVHDGLPELRRQVPQLHVRADFPDHVPVGALRHGK